MKDIFPASKWHPANVGVIVLMNQHQLHADDIAPRAAEIYGAAWGDSTADQKAIITSTVKSLGREPGQTHLEQCCAKAIDEWYAGQEVAATSAPPSGVVAVENMVIVIDPQLDAVDEKPKKKGGK